MNINWESFGAHLSQLLVSPPRRPSEMKTNKPTRRASIGFANYGKCNPSTVTMGKCSVGSSPKIELTNWSQHLVREHSSKCETEWTLCHSKVSFVRPGKFKKLETFFSLDPPLLPSGGALMEKGLKMVLICWMNELFPQFRGARTASFSITCVTRNENFTKRNNNYWDPN